MTYYKSDRVDLHKGNKVKCDFCNASKHEDEMCPTKHLNHRICLSCWKVVWDPYTTGKLPKNYKRIYRNHLYDVMKKRKGRCERHGQGRS